MLNIPRRCIQLYKMFNVNLFIQQGQKGKTTFSRDITCSMCKLHFNFINSTAAHNHQKMCTVLLLLGLYRWWDCLWEIDWIIGVGCSERWLFWSAICILFSMKSLLSKESILLLRLLVFENIMLSEIIMVR